MIAENGSEVETENAIDFSNCIISDMMRQESKVAHGQSAEITEAASSLVVAEIPVRG